MTIITRLHKSTAELELITWRIRQVSRTVARGKQDKRDLESVLAHGYVTKPVDDIRAMNISAAREIDARYKPRKPRIAV